MEIYFGSCVNAKLADEHPLSEVCSAGGPSGTGTVSSDTSGAVHYDSTTKHDRMYTRAFHGRDAIVNPLPEGSKTDKASVPLGHDKMVRAINRVTFHCEISRPEKDIVETSSGHKTPIAQSSSYT